MRFHVRLVAALAVALIAYGILLRAFHWMNLPSDRALYTGIAVIFCLLLFVPVIVRAIWRLL
jgi:heme/copper-type cytochrome/quinol oxidase subunit 4